jgi:hypothetical protein
MRSSPRSSSDGDLDLAVLDANRVGLELDRAVELVLAGPDVVLPAVPGAAQDVTLQPALAKGPLEMEAVTLQREDLVADPGKRDVLLADTDAGQRSRLDLVGLRDSHKSLCHHSILATEGGSFAPMATILLVGVDVFFRGKLDALLPDHHLTTADSIDPPDLVITDISRIDPDEVADAYPDIPIIGFSNHTDTAGLRGAHAAGFDQVLAKSALDEQAKDCVQELLASVD